MILWISTLGFAAFSILLEQTSGYTASGFTQCTIVTNFDAAISASINPRSDYTDGSYSAWTAPGTMDAGSPGTLVELTAQLQYDTLLDWYNDHLDLGEAEDREIAWANIDLRPTEVLGEGVKYEGSVYDGSKRIAYFWFNMWPTDPATGESKPWPVVTAPVKFDFSTAPAPIPIPSAVLLGSLGLGCAGWRIRRAQAA